MSSSSSSESFDWVKPGTVGVITQTFPNHVTEYPENLVCVVKEKNSKSKLVALKLFCQPSQKFIPGLAPQEEFLMPQCSLRPLSPSNTSLLLHNDNNKHKTPPDTTTSTLNGTAPYDKIRSILQLKHLPSELTHHVASYLLIQPVSHPEIRILKASSDRNNYPLTSVLGTSFPTWWISAEDSMPNGRGSEYLEFQLSHNKTLVRISYFGISIPPMPMGPLSVRQFRLEWSLDRQEWHSTDEMQTANLNGLQLFELKPCLEAVFLRLVCLSNAVGATFGLNDWDESLCYYNCVGLYHVRMY